MYIDCIKSLIVITLDYCDGIWKIQVDLSIVHSKEIVIFLGYCYLSCSFDMHYCS